MSYSQDVKHELLGCVDSARHCVLAELSAVFSYLGNWEDKGSEAFVEIKSDNEALIRKCFTLAIKSFNISSGANPVSEQYFLLKGKDDVDSFAEGLKLSAEHKTVDPRLLRHGCCKRAFLRGVFLAAGSMNDPNNSYHLEFVCPDKQRSVQLSDILSDVRVDAKTVMRKGRQVVYIKDGACIVELLGIMGAHRSLMELENLRILKEMRGSINRRVNCETANITKTVTASSRQIEDIILIRDRLGLSELNEGLRDMAAVRLEYPEMPLKELGERLDPPIGKSGVNHRLRKLSEIADRLRAGMPG